MFLIASIAVWVIRAAVKPVLHAVAIAVAIVAIGDAVPIHVIPGSIAAFPAALVPYRPVLLFHVVRLRLYIDRALLHIYGCGLYIKSRVSDVDGNVSTCESRSCSQHQYRT